MVSADPGHYIRVIELHWLALALAVLAVLVSAGVAVWCIFHSPVSAFEDRVRACEQIAAGAQERVGRQEAALVNWRAELDATRDTVEDALGRAEKKRNRAETAEARARQREEQQQQQGAARNGEDWWVGRPAEEVRALGRQMLARED